MPDNQDTLVEDIGLDEVPFSSGDEGNPDLVQVDGLDFEIVDDGVTHIPAIETVANQDDVDNVDNTPGDGQGWTGAEGQSEQGAATERPSGHGQPWPPPGGPT